MNKQKYPTENWWPEPLMHLAKYNPLTDEHFTVAEISKPHGKDSYRHIYTALVPHDLTDKFCEYKGEIGHNIETSGPYPDGSINYAPSFFIPGGELIPEGIEPLILGWSAITKSVLFPDPKFLMTYGLLPRIIISDDKKELQWDDLKYLKNNVVHGSMLSEYNFDLKKEAKILIHKDYLQDYATLRKMSIFQVYFETNVGELSDTDKKLLNSETYKEINLNGIRFKIGTNSLPELTLNAKVWGVRLLVKPDNLPVTEGYEDYGKLTWPGIKKPITKRYWGGDESYYVYVRDSFLKKYEEHPDIFEINPETGSVSYSNQWSLSYCYRIGRDIIQVEIKRMMEGSPPHVVKHLNKFAVECPVGNLDEHRAIENVAKRSKRIVFGLLSLGEELTKSYNEINSSNLSSEEFVSLNREKLNYYGWWKDKYIYSISHHIPIDINERDFLLRCQNLSKVIIEGLKESRIREFLVDLHVDEESIEKYRSLRLLNILAQKAMIAKEAGLYLLSNSKEIEKRRCEKIENLGADKKFETPISLLFLLNDLRIESAHRSNKLGSILELFKVNKESLSSGWGLLLDRLYDSLGECLEMTSKLLENSMDIRKSR